MEYGNTQEAFSALKGERGMLPEQGLRRFPRESEIGRKGIGVLDLSLDGLVHGFYLSISQSLLLCKTSLKNAGISLLLRLIFDV